MQNINDLIALRAQQLKRRDENRKKIAEMLRKMREQRKKVFDDYHKIKNKKIEKNKLILLHNTQHEKNQSSNKKLKYK